MQAPFQWEVLAIAAGILCLLLYLKKWLRWYSLDMIQRFKAKKPHAAWFYVGVTLWAIGGGWPSTWELRPAWTSVVARPENYKNYLAHHFKQMDDLALLSWSESSRDPITHKLTSDLGRRAWEELERRHPKK